MIRLATPGDIPAMRSIYAPYVLSTGYSFEYSVPTEEEFARHCNDLIDELLADEKGI